MAVTAQQIADLAGVSRGTVDRALHNRGRVNPEVKEKIQKIALELGYKPNLIGQALVRSKQDFKLGVILQSTETPTMQVVRAGVQRAAEELAASGVELVLRDFQGLDTELMLEYIEELVSAGVQGIALSPDTAPEVRQCIDELHAQGIPVIKCRRAGQQTPVLYRHGQLSRRSDGGVPAPPDAARGRKGAPARRSSE